MSIMSNVPTPPNGSKWELIYGKKDISFHLPPLGGVGVFDIINIVISHNNFSSKQARLCKILFISVLKKQFSISK